MEILVSITLQAALIFLALAVLLVRFWVRLRIERRSLTLSDYCALIAWFHAFGWYCCSALLLDIGRSHPVDPDTGRTDSVEYLKTVFIATYFYDIGLFWPKASLLAFYCYLIPEVFTRLRIGLAIIVCLQTLAFSACVLTDTLFTQPISDNWSLEHQLDSIWNSYTVFVVTWVLNIATDIPLFCLPFFMLKHLRLRPRQKVGLVVIFSLGAITMIVSIGRFIAYSATDYDLEDAAGNLLCTIEICIGNIVVSLPGLKSLIQRTRQRRKSLSARQETYKPKISLGRIPTTMSSSSSSAGGSGSSSSKALRSHTRSSPLDDELELVVHAHGFTHSLAPTITTTSINNNNAGPQDGVAVTKDFSVTWSSLV